MRASPAGYLIALVGVALVALITHAALPHLGLASAALLFLLPVLAASVRFGSGPALVAAGGGALAFNFFLLPPRFTFRIDSFDHVVTVAVFLAVALVTSRLAAALRAREGEANARAAASAEQAEFAALLAGDAPDVLTLALTWIEARHGAARLIDRDVLPAADTALSSLDLSAAGWAIQGAEVAGHGSDTMPASDWTFLPLAPGHPGGSGLLAVARPMHGTTRTAAELAQLQALARLIGQARDRLALADERHDRERLEDRDALRRTLLAAMAHDFRTPLTVLAGEVAALDGEPTAKNRALAAVHRLGAMMDDLVGAARIEGGAIDPQIEAVDLIDCIDAACDRLASALAGQHVERSLPIDLPLVAADPVLLTHILVNLIGNAARHASARIGISATTEKGRILLHIDDDGSGIADDLHARIFDRFAREAGSDRDGGSGLGLAIVKGFADAMALGVAAHGAPGGGARFTLDLPERRVATA